MYAITRVETGRAQASAVGREPWPWAVNAGGNGHWFASADEAVAFVERELARGEQQIDVGCFQLNIRWHGRAFASAHQMLDPSRNARYAARFLARLYGEFGTWTEAAAAFHSRTPNLSRIYLARLNTVLTEMAGGQGRGSGAGDPVELGPPMAAANHGAARPLAPARMTAAAPGGVALGPLTSGAVAAGAVAPSPGGLWGR